MKQKITAKLANAERIADEAIDLLDRLADLIIQTREQRSLPIEISNQAEQLKAAAKRMREELEG